MSSTISPNMNLVVPTVGSELGPAWANDVNADLSIIDGHNHSSGQGVQINPSGLNINSDLTFNSNNATSLRAARFSAQNSPITNSGSDVGEIYVSGNELYFNDVTGGHQIQITSNGSVNAGAGSITGLPSGTASASFAGSTFTWQSATSTAANMDAASYVLRNATAGSKGLTLQPPNAMASNYSLTLPSVPAATAFMTIDTSGNMGTASNISGAQIAANSIQKTQLAALGQQISTSSGTFTTSNSTLTDVTNLSVTITTTGRPVMLLLIDDGTGASVQFDRSTYTIEPGLVVAFVRGVTVLSQQSLRIAMASTDYVNEFQAPVSQFQHFDTPAAGTYTYKVQMKTSAASTVGISNTKLVAYEL